MSESPPTAVAGACLCGAVRFEVSLPTQWCCHCHCTMCQRNHGAGYVTWFAVPKTQLRLLDAAEGALTRYASSEHGMRSFCSQCGSSLFCENEAHRDVVDVVLANMAAPIDRAPQFHAYFDSKADWVEVSDALPRLGGKTGVEPL